MYTCFCVHKYQCIKRHLNRILRILNSAFGSDLGQSSPMPPYGLLSLKFVSKLQELAQERERTSVEAKPRYGARESQGSRCESPRDSSPGARPAPRQGVSPSIGGGVWTRHYKKVKKKKGERASKRRGIEREKIHRRRGKTTAMCEQGKTSEREETS